MKALKCHLDEVREKKTIRRFFFSVIQVKVIEAWTETVAGN